MKLIVEQLRGVHIETVHRASAVLVDSQGRVRERIGEPIVTTWRSGAKPLQLQVSAGLLPPATVADLDEGDLAIGAASHSGQPVHTARLTALLEHLGLTTEDLYCGTHWPIHDESGRQLLRNGQEATALHNNCSGKHTFMAAAARQQGWEPDYRGPAHPLQAAIRTSLQEHCGDVIRGEVGDGCGVVCWVLPIAAMARGYARLADAMAREEGLLGRIGWAMQRHPDLVSGPDRADGDAVAGATAPLVCKVGAAGLMCGALPEEGLGFALKIHSGDGDARAVALAAVLDRWFPGLLPAQVLAPFTVVPDVIGRPVGSRGAVWSD